MVKVHGTLNFVVITSKHNKSAACGYFENAGGHVYTVGTDLLQEVKAINYFFTPLLHSILLTYECVMKRKKLPRCFQGNLDSH
jgi:hypothetical protein